MKNVFRLIALITILVNADFVFAQNWPQWRGPLATGAAPSGNPPVEWSEQKNIRWKINLPGISYATPVVWGNYIFVTTAIEPGPASNKPSGPIKFVVIAVDRKSGKVLWERLAREEAPHEGTQQTSTWATSSPITDGERVYAFFGSRGLYCYTVEGNLLWEKDFGDMQIRNQFGEGSSPTLYKNRLIVNWDHQGQSFIVALDATTGKEIWRKNRDEETSWTTPLVVEVGGKAQIITTATSRVRTYDLATGDIIWEDAGLTANVIPSPVAADGILYMMSGHRGNALRAIRLSEAKGDISGSSAILWSYNQDTPYVPSPLLQGGLLYFLKSNQGILTCINTATGKPHYSNQRLEDIKSIYASPVGVKDRVYLLSREGVMMVISHGPKFSVIATNRLNDEFDASPVIVGDEIYLRGHKNLYCIAR